MTKLPDLDYPNCIAVPPDATVLWWDGETINAWRTLLDITDNSTRMDWVEADKKIRDAWARYAGPDLTEGEAREHGSSSGPPPPGIYLAVPVERECPDCDSDRMLVEFASTGWAECRGGCHGTGKTSRTEIRRGENIGDAAHALLKDHEELELKNIFRIWNEWAALFFYDDANDAQPPPGVMVTRKDVE